LNSFSPLLALLGIYTGVSAQFGVMDSQLAQRDELVLANFQLLSDREFIQNTLWRGAKLIELN